MSPLAAQEAFAPRPDPDALFTDRIPECQLLGSLVGPRLGREESIGSFLTVFYGAAGVGKSALCGKASEIANEDSFTTVVAVDFDTPRWTRDAPFAEVAQELIACFGEKGIPLPIATLLLALRVVHTVSVEDRSRGSYDIGIDLIDKGAELSNLMPGLGVLFKVGKWMHEAANRKRVRGQAEELGLWPEERYGKLDVRDIDRKIGLALYYDLRAWLADHPERRVTLLIDGYERVQKYERAVDAQLRLQEFLGYCAKDDALARDRLRVVLFGREQLRWNVIYSDSEWTRHWQQHRLHGLEESYAREYLERRQDWFEESGQTSVSNALSQMKEEILNASNEFASGQGAYSPYYLALAAELVERNSRVGTKPDLGATPAELQDHFLKYLGRAESRALMTLALAGEFDESLFDWLAEERIIEYAVHSFHSSLRREHSYFQQGVQGRWRFHRLFAKALRSRWLTDETTRNECHTVTHRLIDYFAAQLRAPERDWSDAEVSAWNAGMEILTTQGLEAGIFTYDEWARIADLAPWENSSHKTRKLEAGFLRRILAVQELVKGPDHADTIGTLVDLAACLIDAGESAKAEMLVRQVVNARERGVVDGPQTITAMNLLALLLDARGEGGEAETLLGSALEASARVLGPEDRLTLICRHNHTTLLRMKGDWSAAPMAEDISGYDLMRQLQEAGIGPMDEDGHFLLRRAIALAFFLSSKGDFVGAERLLRRALIASEQRLGEEHPATLVVMNNLAMLFREKGDIEVAEQWIRRAATTAERVVGLEHPSTLAIRCNLGALLRIRGEWKAAEALQRDVLASRERMFAAEHPDVLTSWHELGAVLQSSGRSQEAAMVLRSTLGARERVIGPEHPQTLQTAHLLACALCDESEYEAAAVICRKTLESQERTLGSESLDALLSLNTLVVIVRATGAFESARGLVERVLEARGRLLGMEHPETLRSLIEAGVLFLAEGKTEESEEALRRGLLGFQRVFGPDNFETLRAAASLATTMIARGDAATAESLLKRAATGLERLLGPNHRNTVAAVSELGPLYYARKEWQAAEKCFRLALDGNEGAYGPDHPNTLSSVYNLGNALHAKGDSAGAIAYCTRAMQGQERLLGPEHPTTLMCVSALAGAYLAKRELAAATPLYQRAVNGRSKVLGEDHPDTLTSMYGLAVLHHFMRDFVAAKRLHRVVLKRRSAVLGADDPETQTSMNALAITLHENGDLESAERMHRLALKSRERTLGVDHEDTLTTVHNLAVLLHAMRKYGQAEHLCRRALESRRRVLGESHPETLSSQSTLAKIRLSRPA